MEQTYLCGILALILVTINGNPIDSEIERPGRIVDGRVEAPGEITYGASLQYSGGFSFCGGTLIKEGWVVTAAHCSRNNNPSDIMVVLGARDLHEPNNPKFGVKAIHIHPYDDKTKIGDVALLELVKKPVQGRLDDSDHKMVPMSMPDSKFDPTGKVCTVSGWGRLTSGGTSPHIMRVVDVNVPTNAICGKMLPAYLPWDSKTDSMICAGGEDKDACQGDSGGPLVCTDDNGNRVLGGIVSWGVGCATEGVPGVYTNVAKYLEWIKNIID